MNFKLQYEYLGTQPFNTERYGSYNGETGDMNAIWDTSLQVLYNKIPTKYISKLYYFGPGTFDITDLYNIHGEANASWPTYTALLLTYDSIIYNFLLGKLLNVFRCLHIVSPFLYLLAKLLALLWSEKYISNSFKVQIYDINSETLGQSPFITMTWT